MGLSIEQLSETRQMILRTLKCKESATIAELSFQLEMTREAVRQQLLQLEHEGWIKGSLKRVSGNSGGRPSMLYCLTPEGDHLFPKHYDSLTLEILDTVAYQLGVEALQQILSKMTEARVREWEPRLQGLGLAERVKALKEIYLKNDTFMDIENSGDRLSLVERNCPFFNVAKQRPALCSVTVSTLTRLLGHRVIRQERFQNGDGRCVFQVMADEPIDKDFPIFTLEP